MSINCQAANSVTYTRSYLGPAAGMLVEREDGGHEMVLKLWGASRVLGTPPAPDCPKAAQAASTLVEAPGLRLTVVTADAEQAQRWQQWLESPVTDLTPSVTLHQLLDRSVQALAAAWAQMDPVRGRPAMVEFVLHLAPANCNAMVQGVPVSAAQARQHMVFPLVMSEALLQHDMSRVTGVQQLLELLTHEAAHLMQLYPYTLPMLNRYLAGGGYLYRGEDTHKSTQGEAGAQLVTLALMQAILPQDKHSGWRKFLLWARAEPATFAKHIKNPGLITLAQWQAEQPEAWQTGVPTEESLALLFAQAVMELDRDLSQPRARPDASQLTRGKAALDAVRRVIPQPYLISGPLRGKDLYSDAPLTPQELRELRRTYRR